MASDSLGSRPVVFMPCQFNATAVWGSELHSAPFGLEVMLLAGHYVKVQEEITATIIGNCFPDGTSRVFDAITQEGLPFACDGGGECLVEPIRDVVLSSHGILNRVLRSVARRLQNIARIIRRPDAWAMAGDVEELERRTRSFDISAQCAQLAFTLLDKSITGCVRLSSQLVHCALSLGDEARHVIGRLRALQAQSLDAQAAADRGLNSIRPLDWDYRSDLGWNRAEIVGTLLQEAGPRPLAVEIGVHTAASSEALLRRFPMLEMLLVDPYHAGRADSTSPQAVFEEALQRTLPFRDRATFMLQRSDMAAKYIEEGAYDLVFVDGDHRYKAVYSDIRLWWPALRTGGVMVGHDYCAAYPGVVRAVHEFVESVGLSLSLGLDDTWWFFKV